MSTKQKRSRDTAEVFEVSKYFVEAGVETHTVVIPDTGDEFTVQIKPIPWSKRNKIISECLTWKDGGEVDFDGDNYVRACLKLMLVSAPWGNTDERFLSSIDARLGSALEALVPKAFGEDSAKVDESKKE